MALLCGKPDVGLRDSRVLICPKSAPIAVSKTDNMKIIDPDTNQSADAWLLAYRKFHDLWIKDNALPCVRVCAVAGT